MNLDNLKILKTICLKQKILILLIVIVNTLIAFSIKNIIVSNYSKNAPLQAQMNLSIGYNVYYDTLLKKTKKAFIQNPSNYFVSFKDDNVELKIDRRLEVVSQSKFYLYTSAENKQLINKYFDVAIKKIKNIELEIVRNALKNPNTISYTVYSQPIGQVLIVQKEHYLNNYFVLSVCLLSLIFSIVIATYKEIYLTHD